jgi:hypothetical protein
MLGKPSRHLRHKLESEGRTAVATVLAIADHGMSVTTGNDQIAANTEVVLKTHLRVEPTGEPAFEVEQRFRYSQFGVPGVGDKLTVRYDAEDHEKLMIDRSQPVVAVPGAGGAPLDVSGLLATVQAAKAQAGGDRHAMAEALRASLGGSATIIEGAASAPAAGPAAAEAGTIDMLERLAKLRDAGALTPEEFAAQKARLLS